VVGDVDGTWWQVTATGGQTWRADVAGEITLPSLDLGHRRSTAEI